jgi:predicted metal-dependent peptidase
LGGTEIQPAIDYIADPKNKLNTLNTIILTDGYTDSLNFSKIKTKTILLTTGVKCNITHDNGKLKQVVIEKDN